VINTVTWYSPWMGWIWYVLVAGAAMCVIADLVVGRHSLFARPLAWGPMVFIGRISYGLYLLHLPVYYMVEHVMPEAPLVSRLTVKVTVSVGCAAASYYLVERRFLRLKERFESREGRKEVVKVREMVTGR
jgi:peptidoglycan/LPS O-acetylase OafA/YrhL